MGELLAAILENFGDVLLEVFLQLIFEVFASAIAHLIKKNPKWRPAGRLLTAFVSFLVGTFLGFVSILIIPVPLFHHTRIPGLSLLIGPPITGLSIELISRLWRGKDEPALPWESFWGGFAFAFGLALVRWINSM